MAVCKECAFSRKDDRKTVYRREECWFCAAKGPYFSRNYRIGEGTRIDPQASACERYIPRKTNRSE